MKKQRRVNLRSSKINHKQIVQNETNCYRCSDCFKVFCSSGNLTRHRKNIHNVVLPHLKLSCAYCSRKFCLQENKTLHEKKHLEKAMLLDKFKAWKCSYCPSTFKHEKAKINHENTHVEKTMLLDKTKLKVWKCSHCPSTFKLEEKKIIHEKKHLKKAKVLNKTNVWKCSRCPSIFKLELHKKSHERKVHSGRNSFVCNLCKGSFNKLISLSWHKYVYHWKGKMQRVKSTAVKRRRTRVKPEPVTARTKHGVKIVYADKFSCSYCPMTLSSVKSKERHEIKHTGKLPYCCKFCSVSFALPCSHMRHQRECRYLHKMVWCKFCDFHTFDRYSSLENHYKRMHGFKFESDIELEFHLREIQRKPVIEFERKSSEYDRSEASNDDELAKNGNSSSSEFDDELEETNQDSIFESSFEYFEDDEPVKNNEMQVHTENNVRSDHQLEEIIQDRTYISQINDQLEEMFRDHDSNSQSEISVFENVTTIEVVTNIEQVICETEVSLSNEELIEELQDGLLNHATGDCLEEQNYPHHDTNIKSEVECSEAFSESAMQQDPVDEKLIKFEIEVAQLNNKLKEIFQTDQISENCANSECQVEQNSSCRVVDLTYEDNEDSDDEFEYCVIVIDDDD